MPPSQILVNTSPVLVVSRASWEPFSLRLFCPISSPRLLQNIFPYSSTEDKLMIKLHPEFTEKHVCSEPQTRQRWSHSRIVYQLFSVQSSKRVPSRAARENLCCGLMSQSDSLPVRAQLRLYTQWKFEVVLYPIDSNRYNYSMGLIRQKVLAWGVAVSAD